MIKRNLLIVFLIIITSITLFGIKIEKSSNKVIEKGNFDDDYLFKGNELEFGGSADDLYFFGQRLNFTGVTNSSIFALGKELIINGKIKNNIMTSSESINIFGEINGTAFISGKNITIQNNSILNGDLFILGKKVNLSGTVNGDVIIGSANLTIDGIINGDVKIYTGKINITNNGKINGNLKYQSENELSDQEKLKITKSVEFNKSYKWQKKYSNIEEKNVHKFFKMGFIIIKLFILIGFIIGGFLLLLFPIMNKIEEERTSKRFWFSSLWGLIPILIYPALIFILFMFGITLPLAVIVILSGLPFLFVTKVLGVTMLGQYLFNKFKWNNTKRYLYFLFGVIFYAILSFIPFVAFISMIFFSSLGWGYILEGLFNKKFS